MTKTLTEQWREGTLPDGYYYVVSKWSKKIEINDYYEGCWQDLKEEYIKEVLAPVPSYDEYKELVRKSDKLDKIMSDSATNQGDCQQIVEDNLNRQIERLQEQLNEERNARQKSDIAFDNIRSLYREAVGQLNEANEAIMSMIGNGPHTADEIGQAYLEKWGVK